MTEYIVGTDGHEGHWLTGEEIVRCRDCAKANEGTRFDGSHVLICTRFSMFNYSTKPGNFCSWGKRRNNENV